MHVSTPSELATTIHANIFVGAIGSVVGQPIVEPLHGRSFGGKSTTVEATAEIVCDESITGLAVDTDQTVLTLGIAAPLHHEAEIDRDALVADSRTHCGSGSGGLFSQLGGKADRAGFEFVRYSELWYPFYETMHRR